MKRSDALNIIMYNLQRCVRHDQLADDILNELEQAGMLPPQYINPKAIKDGLDNPKTGYIEYLDRYPEHHFTYKNPKPYEYYLEGWEPEDD